MHENRFNEYRIPSGMLFVFLEKALTLMHMETHLDDVSIQKCPLFCFINDFFHKIERRNKRLSLAVHTADTPYLRHKCRINITTRAGPRTERNHGKCWWKTQELNHN